MFLFYLLYFVWTTHISHSNLAKINRVNISSTGCLNFIIKINFSKLNIWLYVNELFNIHIQGN